MLTAEMTQEAKLLDGSAVSIRPIRPDDAPRLQVFHTRLSEESILYRFMGHPRVLSDEQARDLANIDFVQSMALVGVVFEDDEERLVGVARYVMIPCDTPGCAEAAIVVEDAYQRRGLGAVLSDHLVAYAQKHGIRKFISFILPENTQVLRLMRHCGLSFKVVSQDSDMLEVHITLPHDAEP